MFLILLSTLFLIANCHPLQENVESLPTTTETTTDVPSEAQNELVAYIAIITNEMTQYVTSQYRDLDIHETEQLKTVIEEFLINFKEDLRQVVENQGKNDSVSDYQEIQNGGPEEALQAIGEKVQEEFPEITEDMAKEIVYRLRKNLLETTNKLDALVIRHAQRVKAEIEVDN